MSDVPPTRDPSPNKRDERAVAEFRRLSQLAVEFIGYMAVLGYAGYRMDQAYGWNRRGILAGLMLALAAWLYRVYRRTRGMFR